MQFAIYSTYGRPLPPKIQEFQMVQTTHSCSCVGYEIAQSTNSLAFFAGIDKDKRKQSSQNINGLATHIKAGHEMVKQSSQNIVQLLFNMV